MRDYWLSKLFFDLQNRRHRIRPREANAGGALLQLFGAQQRRQPQRHTVEHARGLAATGGGGRPLGRLVLLPGAGLGRGRLDPDLAEDVRMSLDHLA